MKLRPQRTPSSLVAPILVAAIGGLVASGCAVATLAPGGPAQGKTVLCHKGKTLEVADAAVDAHLGHGDTLGRCR